MIKRLSILLLIVLVSACAKRGTISEGSQDTLAPVMKYSDPPNFTTDFKGNIIKLGFNEYIKIKDANKQVIVSPPMENPPVISPTTASKTISIKFKDTLRENTTYSINFGQSILDNNEGNAFKDYKYVFSTGKYIDSLTISGTVKDSFTKDVESFVSVQLYDVNDDYTDSIIYKKPPRYVTNTLDSGGKFKFENLKAGTYQLVALKDLNSNYKLDTKREKVGFRKEYITIPTDTIYQLKLFSEIPEFKAYRPAQASANRAFIPISGSAENMVATLYNGNVKLRSTVTNVPKKDSVQIWFEPPGVDSLRLEIQKGKYRNDALTLKLRKLPQDTLAIKSVTPGTLSFREDYILESTIPLEKIDEKLISVVYNDSVDVKYTIKYDSLAQRIHFKFSKLPVKTYRIRMLPNALTDFYGHKNDTLRFNSKTIETSDFGNLKLVLNNIKSFPIIVQLTDAKGDFVAEEISDAANIIEFMNVPPNIYTVRVIYDVNKNKRWDTGNFLDKTQGEEVDYFGTSIDVRQNWDVEQIIDLGG